MKLRALLVLFSVFILAGCAKIVPYLSVARGNHEYRNGDYQSANIAYINAAKSEHFEDMPRFIVSGSTPLSTDTEKITTDIAKKNNIYVVRAPNFSINVNRFFYDMEHIADPSPNDDISINEIHRQEKASTSGTAGEIAKTLCQRFGRTGYMTFLPTRCLYSPSGEIVIDEDRMTPDRLKDALKNPAVIKISSERFADEPGMHIVRIGNQDNYREWKVRATRKDYGEGVVSSIRAFLGFTAPKACDFKAPGVYDFKSEVLGL